MKTHENYGWNLSSYGESYNKQRSDKPNYKKNHKKPIMDMCQLKNDPN